jgi:hypothetical protein
LIVRCQFYLRHALTLQQSISFCFHPNVRKADICWQRADPHRMTAAQAAGVDKHSARLPERISPVDAICDATIV